MIEPFFGDPKTMLIHGITFGGHPLSCAIALANLEVFERDDLIGHVREMTPVFQEEFGRLADEHPLIGDLRGVDIWVEPGRTRLDFHIARVPGVEVDDGLPGALQLRLTGVSIPAQVARGLAGVAFCGLPVSHQAAPPPRWPRRPAPAEAGGGGAV